MASIARENLFENISRFLIAQAGVLFAVGLVTLQIGTYIGFTRSTSVLITRSRSDLWVTANNMAHLGLTTPLEYEQVAEARQVEGVEWAEALILRATSWRNPEDQLTSITLVGVEPESELFAPLNLSEGESNLQKPYNVIVDQTSLDNLNVQQINETGVIGSLPASIVGLVSNLQSLVFSPILFTSLESAKAYSASPPTLELPCYIAAPDVNCRATDPDFPPELTELTAEDPITYVLIRAEPGTNLNVLQQRLEEALPETQVLTQEQMAEQTQEYWQQRSGIGIVLGLGATIGVVVGVVVVSQILYASVSEHIREFGTLKAIGASDQVIFRVIGEQALWMAILGYLPGLGVSLAIADWAATQGILVLITPWSALGVLGITLVMCFSAAGLAIRRVLRIDPAMVFRS